MRATSLLRLLNRTLPAFLPTLLVACPGDTGDSTASEPSGGTDSTGSTGTTEPVSTDPTTTGPTTTSPDTTTDTTTTGTTDPTTLDTTSDTSTSDTTTDTTDTGTSTETTAVDPGECVPGESRSCYGGPDGTEGVGNCVAGQQQCGDDALWGPCEGEVVPARETCEEIGDEDCDGVDACAPPGALAWGMTFGQGGHEVGTRVVFDAAGNIVVAAWGTGPVDFGGGTLNNLDQDVFLAKFSPAGDLLWGKRFGEAGDQGGADYGLAVTPAGHIVLAGDFAGAIDFGGGLLENVTATNDLFLVELTGDGDHVWSKSFHGGDALIGTKNLVLADNGDILITGFFFTSLELGGAPLIADDKADAFVARFTPTGAHVWSRRFGGSDYQLGGAIDLDADGNAYVTGWFWDSIDAGTGPLVSTGADDLFLAKLDPAGATVWAKHFGDAGNQRARGLVVDSGGRVTIAGPNRGSVDFGGGPLAAPQGSGFLAQFDGDGAHLWSRLLCTDGSNASDLATDGFDNLITTGNFLDTCDLDGEVLVSLDQYDAYLGKFSPQGQLVWGKRFGGPDAQLGAGVAGSATGVVAVTGTFLQSIDLGQGILVSEGNRDGFLAAFEP
ncbi:SBBP repeat-containing protein [Nannocystis sp. RBIL2]|uniref:SBBP repeat-containing protein n=1 Tax=Nannocystis sp. RBIL2 TaxID=2996788 RepID=UPI00226DBE6A|nr:SBBP repeat-containing protein [Nannocystis sp. RBIL2]MCY1070622.1 SBBP repeat-containing protein [Nannocystis sp. RBIL2]